MAKWSVPISKMTASAVESLQQVTERVVVRMFDSVVDLSPVDTGKFKANWSLSYSPVASGGATGSAAAKSFMRGHTGQRVYIINPLPYAERLEYGWSGQAPNGMVRITMREVDRFVKEAIAEGLRA